MFCQPLCSTFLIVIVDSWILLAAPGCEDAAQGLNSLETLNTLTYNEGTAKAKIKRRVKQCFDTPLEQYRLPITDCRPPRYASLIVTVFIVSPWRMALTISMPSRTLPKTVCLPFRCDCGLWVMKNCEPLVFAPAFAIESTPVS